MNSDDTNRNSSQLWETRSVLVSWPPRRCLPSFAKASEGHGLYSWVHLRGECDDGAVFHKFGLLQSRLDNNPVFGYSTGMEKQNIIIFRSNINLDDVKKIAAETFGEMAKAVIDIDRNIIAVGGELHADAEAVLLEDGSSQANLWGINIYPDKSPDEQIEYTSLINIRPSIGNRSQEIEDQKIRDQIRRIVDQMTKESK